jgi:hypothetical protein
MQRQLRTLSSGVVRAGIAPILLNSENPERPFRRESVEIPAARRCLRLPSVATPFPPVSLLIVIT